MLLLLLQPKGSAVTRHESLVSALEETHRLLERHVVWPSSAAADAATLWVAHACALDAFDNTARLVLRSAENQNGKTRAQDFCAGSHATDR